MASDPLLETAQRGGISFAKREHLRGRLADLPWWLFAIIGILVWVFYFIFSNEEYKATFNFVIMGLRITIETTIYAYIIALVIGMFVGLGRVSRNTIIRNASRFYVEVVRGIPILVLIFYVALVLVVDFAAFLGIEARDLSSQYRAIAALAIIYGAYLAEIFRAGIQSIGRGQMEAARSLGMSYAQAMRYIILPQAVRNVLPALGNDFISMLKDSSLVSVLAVRDITQYAQLYSGSTFRFREAFTVLSVLYLTMTLILSALVQWLERRLHAQR